MDLNRVVLQGMVGTDLELRKTTTSKKAVTSFRVATTAHFKDEEGTIIESTQWHNVVAWEDMAELAVANLQKGSQVYIEGSLRTRSYEAEVREGSKKVNTTLYVTEVVVRSIQPIDVHPVTNGKDSTEARA